MFGIEFQQPSNLWWLLVAILVVSGYLLLRSRLAPKVEKRLTTLDLLEQAEREAGNRWRRWLPVGFTLLAVTAAGVQWAQPVAATQVRVQQATVMLAIDCSLSMQADDVEPTRFDAVKAASSSAIDIMPADLKVGVVCFDAGTGQLVPPTTDHASVQAAISRFQLGNGTAIGGAIVASLDQVQLANESGVPAHIILLSDGSPSGDSVDYSLAAGQAAEAGVPISTIAFGTEQGTLLVNDQRVPVLADRGVLKDIAEATGGGFYESADEASLTGIYGSIASSFALETVTRPVSWFLVVAFIMAAAAAIAHLFVYRTRWSR